MTEAFATEETLLAQRLAALTGELQVAWSRSDAGDLRRWGRETAADLGVVFSRRVANLGALAVKVVKGTVAEGHTAYTAYQLSNLSGHLESRVKGAGDSASRLYERASNDLGLLGAALKERPGEVAPKLLTALITSLLVSGGPDGNGGAPDLDLMFGIGAHRSIFSHSILMGSALETTFLSLLRLVRLVHEKLPTGHDPGWDLLLRHANEVARGAIAGAGVGMANHLVVDGLLQPAAYHDLPMSAPMEVHQGILATNSIAEAQDLQHKGKPGEPNGADVSASGEACQQGLSALASDADGTRGLTRGDDAHRTHLRVRTEVGGMVASLMPRESVEVICKHGAWLAALSDGKLDATTPAQKQFIRVANWEADPDTLQEQAWRDYALARIAVLLTLGPTWTSSVRSWFS